MSGIPELVEDGRTGLLVEPEDPSALADAMERLLRDPILRKTLAAAARCKIEGSFECWETAKAVGVLLSPVQAQ
jgi:glycosyltransferase involved in cell wall biosynthesis